MIPAGKDKWEMDEVKKYKGISDYVDFHLQHWLVKEKKTFRNASG